MTLKFKSLIAFSALAIVLAACTSTKIIGSWKNSDFADKKYGSIMIVGLSTNVVAKASVEQQMATVLVAKKVNAKGAGGIFAPEIKHTKEEQDQIFEQFKADGFDGVLTLALVAEEQRTEYTPGTYSYAPYYSPGYYGSYWGYYGYYAPQVYSPGYYTEHKVYTIEALLYDVETEKLVWGARSETTDPTDMDSFSHEYAETVVFQLQKDQMLKPGL